MVLSFWLRKKMLVNLQFSFKKNYNLMFISIIAEKVAIKAISKDKIEDKEMFTSEINILK